MARGLRPNHQPAIDVQRLSGDVGSGGRCKERDDGRDLLRPADAAQRNAR